MHNRPKVLDIPFDPVTLPETITQIQTWCRNSKQHHIATPNPEILLKTLENPKYKELLQKTSLNTPDGIGILWAATYLNKIKTIKSPLFQYIKGLDLLFKTAFKPNHIRNILPARVTGTDILAQFLSPKTTPNPKIFLLGAAQGVATKLSKTHPQANIVGTFSGSPSPKDTTKAVEKINDTAPAILFVAFGAPAQEIWINQNLHKIPSVKVAIGVGGAFDFLSGKLKRAPKILQKLGLEWLYRLIQEPRRIKRIYNATIKFPLAVIKKGPQS